MSALLPIIPCNSPCTLCSRHGGMSVWKGVCDMRTSCGIQEADRQTLEPSLGRQPTAGLIHAGVPVWCIHTHKHTSSFNMCKCKYYNYETFSTSRRFWDLHGHKKTLQPDLKNVWKIPLHYIMSIKPRGNYLNPWASSFTLGTFTVKRDRSLVMYLFSSGTFI